MKKLKKQLHTNKLIQLLEIIFVFLIAFIIIKLFLKPEGENLLYNQGVVWIANIAMLLTVWLGIKIRGEDCRSFGLSFKIPSFKESLKIFLMSLLAFVLAMVGFGIGSVIMANITGIPEQADMSSYAFLQDNIGLLLLTLAGVYAASSFGEEVIYRGFLINRMAAIGLNTKMANITAVIISSIIFGLVHYSWGTMGMVQTGFMGLALGLCYIYMNKRLWILILAHAYMDTILMVQLYLANQ